MRRILLSIILISALLLSAVPVFAAEALAAADPAAAGDLPASKAAGGLPSGPGAAAEGGPVRIAFIDSGISTKHIDAARVEAGRNYVFPEADTQDRIGHGSATAGLVLGSSDQGVAGIFPEAVAVPLVVIDAYPSGAVNNGGPEALTAAIYDAVDLFGCDIINISLSLSEDPDELRGAVLYAESRGVLIVTCAGNDGAEGPVYYPAAYETALSVGAADGKVHASFSQQGADIITDGTGLTAPSNRNGAAPQKLSGTSYSCAIITGVCARIKAACPDSSPAEIRDVLFSLAEDVEEPGPDAFSGRGHVAPDIDIPGADSAGTLPSPGAVPADAKAAKAAFGALRARLRAGSLFGLAAGAAAPAE